MSLTQQNARDDGVLSCFTGMCSVGNDEAVLKKSWLKHHEAKTTNKRKKFEVKDLRWIYCELHQFDTDYYFTIFYQNVCIFFKVADWFKSVGLYICVYKFVEFPATKRH